MKLVTIIDWFKKKRDMFIGLGLCLVTLMVLVLLADYVVMPLYTHHGVERELPDVTELSFDEAKKLLQDNGFKILLERERYEATYPESTVVQQTPPPYSMVKKGRRIYVTISAGEKRIAVPNVVGISERGALNMLLEAGLETGDVYYEYDNYRPKGVVIRQTLAAGSEVPEHSVISVIVSNGVMPTSFEVPNLVGKSLETAKKMLQQNGLILGRVEYRVKKELIPETVLEQSLKPNTRVPRGYSVDLIVSKLEENSWE